jgi:hypothetical protein
MFIGPCAIADGFETRSGEAAITRDFQVQDKEYGFKEGFEVLHTPPDVGINQRTSRQVVRALQTG